jgi:hypothetical protein
LLAALQGLLGQLSANSRQVVANQDWPVLMDRGQLIGRQALAVDGAFQVRYKPRHTRIRVVEMVLNQVGLTVTHVASDEKAVAKR